MYWGKYRLGGLRRVEELLVDLLAEGVDFFGVEVGVAGVFLEGGFKEVVATFGVLVEDFGADFYIFFGVFEDGGVFFCIEFTGEGGDGGVVKAWDDLHEADGAEPVADVWAEGAFLFDHGEDEFVVDAEGVALELSGLNDIRDGGGVGFVFTGEVWDEDGLICKHRGGGGSGVVVVGDIPLVGGGNDLRREVGGGGIGEGGLLSRGEGREGEVGGKAEAEGGGGDELFEMHGGSLWCVGLQWGWLLILGVDYGFFCEGGSTTVGGKAVQSHKVLWSIVGCRRSSR